jgi:hypothetical protein
VLKELEGNAGSIVLIAIDFVRVTTGLFSTLERKSVAASIGSMPRKRQNATERRLTEGPP